MTRSDDELLPHMRVEQLAGAREWRGFVGVDNVHAIAERFTRIVVPGRTFVIVRRSEGALRPSRVEHGASLYTGPALRPPVEVAVNVYGAGVSVNMGPRIGAGFSVSVCAGYHAGLDTEELLTAEQVRDAVHAGGRLRARFDWSWLEISGGVDGYSRDADRISMLSCNEHGHRELVEVIAADASWETRVDRDALAAEQIAAALEADGNAAAAAAVRAVGARVLADREPLSVHEQFRATSQS